MTPRYAPRFAAHVDASQREVCETLAALGCSIQYLHAVGRGCADLLVGLNGMSFAVEVKNPKRPNRWEADQIVWWQRWNGNERVVLTDRDSAAAWVQRVRSG